MPVISWKINCSLQRNKQTRSELKQLGPYYQTGVAAGGVVRDAGCGGVVSCPQWYLLSPVWPLPICFPALLPGNEAGLSVLPTQPDLRANSAYQVIKVPALLQTAQRLQLHS